MRVLRDECVPKRLRSELAAHFVRTVAEAGWAGLTNGRLRAAAATDFDCLPTMDRNLQYQQRVGDLPLSVLVIAATDNKFETLRQGMDAVRAVLETLPPRELAVVRI